MRIYFERTGGFAGMQVVTTVDTESLPSEEAHDLYQMVDKASFFDLPEVIATSTSGADQFQYKLTVEAEKQQHTVKTGDATAPDELWPLLRHLTTLARSSGR